MFPESMLPRLAFLGALGLVATAAAAEISFNRDIRPILTKNCTTCHGGVKKAGGVSFLFREDLLGRGDSGRRLVTPGQPDESELIRRIRTRDPLDRMPPPDHHPEPLADADVALLSAWIEQGAEWQDHWAYEPPSPQPVPTVSDPSWPRQPLDHWILARLDQEGLAPATEADPVEWLRRVCLDLTGLPPTPAQLADFQQRRRRDPAAARADFVDRLLASPAYGERWASMWLDLARYSDTYGFEKDPHRTIWPYRDWVIDAFNADMPYDQFTIRQLAGDLLEHPDPIATAFHRNTQNNTEGGSDDEEFRMAAVIDRVNTTWTTWNATTFGCVQCHDHPYDPIPHRDYYRFLDFFNQSEDADLNDDWPKTKVAENPAHQAEITDLERQIRELRREQNQSLRQAAERVASWQVLRFSQTIAQPDTGQLHQRDDGVVVSSGTIPTHSEYRLESEARPIAALRIEIFPEQDDPVEWRGTGAVISQIEAKLVDADGSERPIPLADVAADFLAGPFDPRDSLEKNDGGFGEYPATHQPRTAWFIARETLQAQADERLIIRIRHAAKCNETQSCILPRFRIATTADPAVQAPLSTDAWQQALKRLAELKKTHRAIPGTAVPTMRERSDTASRTTRLFIRGNRMTLGDVVTAGVPDLFGGEDVSSSRLAMARWLVSDRNPLAARTLANRLWAQIFGIGIVETQEDFGSSGSPPSHPELLDHLALRLRDHHQWRIKPFLRELVLSASYAQSHQTTPALQQRDPDNRLLARGPRQRLSAEMVRDQALLVSGLLVREIGGPPVFPPQPEGIWNSVYNGSTWTTSTGPDRYRRALYTYHKRTAGYPAFLTFDASPRDVCLPRRIATNTPLQALVTLNDPAHIEFAQALAQRMTDASTDRRAQIAHGYHLLTLRPADPATLDILEELHAETSQEYRHQPEESAKLAATPEQAAMVLVANTLLNADFALNR